MITITDFKEKASRLRNLLVDLDQEINHVASLEDEQRQLQETILPGMMEELGITEFKLDDGTIFKLSNDIHPSWPKDPKQVLRAVNELEKAGYGDVVKIEVSMSFPKTQLRLAEEVAKRAKEFVQKKGGACEIEVTRSVHGQTLKKVIRECYEAGKKISDDVFGVFHRTLASVSLPGTKKAITPKKSTK